MLWLAWGGYWLLAARNVKQNLGKESVAAQLGHLLPLALAALLLLMPAYPVISMPLIARTQATVYAGLALTVAGMLFTLWARASLGRNWSALVAIKHGHELIVAGPYAYVRHPIYSGLIVAFAGGCLAQGELRSLLALVIVILTFYCKLKREEQWLAQTFGTQYEMYKHKVKALIPYLI